MHNTAILYSLGAVRQRLVTYTAHTAPIQPIQYTAMQPIHYTALYTPLLNVLNPPAEPPGRSTSSAAYSPWSAISVSRIASKTLRPRKWSGVPVLLLIASDPRHGAVAGTLGPVEAWVDAIQAHSSLGGALGIGEHHQVERHCRSAGRMRVRRGRAVIACLAARAAALVSRRAQN